MGRVYGRHNEGFPHPASATRPMDHFVGHVFTVLTVSILLAAEAILYILGASRLSESLLIRGRLARRVREEAERLGISVDEYLVGLLSQDLDPKDKALEYVKAAEDLLEEAREELGKGNVKQAAEKLWEAAALTVKAYAYLRDGKRLTSHGELWEWKRRLEDEPGEWVHDAWADATAMHVCFYEDWCKEKDVATARKRVERPVKEVASLISRGSRG